MKPGRFNPRRPPRLARIWHGGLWLAGWLVCCDQIQVMAGYSERGSPVKRPHGDVGASGITQCLRILICADVNDAQAAAGSQYPHGFVQCLFAPGVLFDVVDR